MNLLPPPGPERRRQLTLLSVLVVVLAVYFGYRYWPTAGSGAASSNSEVRTASTTKDKLQGPPGIRIDSLEPAPPGSDPSGRNPFRFGQPPAPPVVARPPVEQPVYVAPPPQPPPPPQVPLQLLSLGKVTDTNQRLINLIDDAGTNFWVRPVEGEIIDGKYKLVKVNADSVIVAFRDGSGQKPLYLSK